MSEASIESGETAPRQRIGQWVVVEAQGAQRLVEAATVRDPYAIVMRGDDKLLVARINLRARLVIGRAAEADLPLTFDPTVSGVHASLERHLNLVTIEDLGPSTNGTFVNGQRITARTTLRDRDVVRCAGTEIVMRCPPASADGGTVAMLPTIDWSGLTPTERRVVVTLLELWPPDARLQRAPTTAALGDAMGLGSETVRSHLKSIYAKLRQFDVEPTREALAAAADDAALELLGSG